LPVRDFHPLEAPDFPWRTDDVVEIPATADLDGFPDGIVLPQHTQRTVTGSVAVEIELGRP